MAKAMNEEKELEKEIPIESANLQSATMIPGGKTEVSLNQNRVPGIKLSWIEGDSLVVEYRGGRSRIPLANVKIANEFKKKPE